jgi:hypothetical protein
MERGRQTQVCWNSLPIITSTAPIVAFKQLTNLTNSIRVLANSGWDFLLVLPLNGLMFSTKIEAVLPSFHKSQFPFCLKFKPTSTYFFTF